MDTRTSDQPDWTTRRFIGWLLGLIIVTIGVRVVSPTGWQGADDALYYSAAESVLAGAPLDHLHHHGSRMAMVVPIAASVSLLGTEPQAVILPTIVASIACVLLVAILGRMVWGPFVGILAATIVSFLPCFRLYSTTAFPDIHGCMWGTLAVVLALSCHLGRRPRHGLIWALGIGCGMSIGLATSAKIFSVTVLLPVCAVLWAGPKTPPRQRGLGFCAVTCGLVLFILIDGLFYYHATNDFFYKYHILSALQSNDAVFASQGSSLSDFVKDAWHRLSMPFNPDRSTWGIVALAFWPAAIVVLLRRAPGRIIAFWAVAAYLLIALMPIRFEHGPQIFPFFKGRTALTTCIPFALCTAWIVHTAIRRWVPNRLQRIGAPVVLGLVVVASFAAPSAVAGIRNSHTKVLGVAIRKAIETTDWAGAEDVFVHPSLYMRYRILFPNHLRARLRVTADADSPKWWRHCAPDIASRTRSLPAPGKAYLLATPAQLRAEPERWDYGVTLPLRGLARWAYAPAVTAIGARPDGTIGAVSVDTPHGGKPLICVLAGRDDKSTRFVSGDDLNDR